jgi:RNA polymerase sigma factor (sigma-70 family)
LQTPGEINKLTDHLFRTEYGKMVASLTRIFGMGQMSVAEDIVQDAMVLALNEWRFRPVPPNPVAWLYVVAKNKAIDYLRREKNTKKITSDLQYLLASEYTLATTVNTIFTEEGIRDSQLRMMFALCHPDLSIEAQITLILKTLCGFGNDEIAKAFITNTENINKRLYRAKEKLRQNNELPQVPTGKALLKRLDAVLKSIYLLFNEGYHSSSGIDRVMRHDLCFEAMHLCILLTENKPTNLPQVNALLALMCFNTSRFNARESNDGEIILYPHQDRNLWDKNLINRGVYYLNIASVGNAATTYHIEAAIASYYCQSASFKDTDWQAILQWYNLLLTVNPSPMVVLSKAVVMGYGGQTDSGLKLVLQINGLEKHPLYHATLGDLYALSGDRQKAAQHYENAIKLTNNLQQKKMLEKKILKLK